MYTSAAGIGVLAIGLLMYLFLAIAGTFAIVSIILHFKKH
jgi:hypothetical protein